MEYTTVTNPVYANAAHTLIRCEVKFTEFSKPVPFTASADDVVQHGTQLFADLVAGKYGKIAAYTPAVQPPAQQYQLAIAKGLTVSSAPDSSLKGTYSVDSTDYRDIMHESQFIGMYSEFSTGKPSYLLADAQG